MSSISTVGTKTKLRTVSGVGSHFPEKTKKRAPTDRLAFCIPSRFHSVNATQFERLFTFQPDSFHERVVLPAEDAWLTI
jgi:hypothetical protein